MATGFLTSFLVIPPGYASPIWPAAAIGLIGVFVWGYRYLPSVFVASMVVNLWISYKNGIDWYLSLPLLIGALVALGAVLQATLSCYLLGRVFSLKGYAEGVGDVAWLVLLGGPIGCVVNSFFSTTMLLLLGALAAEGFWANWFTWWLGDSLGVFCFAPVLLYLLRPGSRSPKRVRLGIAIGHLLVFCLVLVAVGHIKRVELSRMDVEFDNAANRVEAKLGSILDINLEVLQGVSSFFVASNSVSSEEFEVFSRDHVESHAEIYGISWNEGVTRSGRAAFEERMRSGGFEGFEIKDRAADNSLVRAGERDVYYPVTFVAPRESNGTALGFDVYANESRRLAMDEAIATGNAVATSRVRLVQVPENVGILVYHPAFVDGAGAGSEPLGFAVGIFLADVLAAPLQLLADEGMYDVVLRDLSAEAGERVIFESGGLDQRLHKVPFGKSKTFPVSFAGSRWELDVLETEAAVSRNDGSGIWVAAIAGFLFSGLAGVVMLFVSGRSDVVNRLVEEQTKELGESNKELVLLAKKAEQASLAKSQFLASMSHEIRTPMNGIIGILHILRDDLPESHLTMLDVASQSADKLMVLINDLLDLSKIEEGKLTLDLRETTSLSLVEEVCSLHDAAAAAKGLLLVGRVDPEGCRTFVADHFRLSQVLSNLVSNAIKFTDSGSVEVSCDYVETDGVDTIRFAVKDTGIGIAEEYRGELFQAFTQADAGTTRKFGGTGLGLSICKRLLGLMGGDIELRASSGDGTEFVVTLPLQDGADKSLLACSDVEGKRVLVVHPDVRVRSHLSSWIESWGARVTLARTCIQIADERGDDAFDFTLIDESEWSSPARSEGGLGTFFIGYRQPDVGLKLRSGEFGKLLSKPIRIDALIGLFEQRIKARLQEAIVGYNLDAARVLLVDDNATNTLVASAIMKRRHGIQARIARNGEEALGLLRSEEFDVIFMDCMMPVMDGYIATQALRGGEAGDLNRNKPVIALTANAMQEDEQRCLDAGMSSYISKPIDPQKLEESLRVWIGRLHAESGDPLG